MTLNFWSFFLHLPKTEIICVPHHAWFMWCWGWYPRPSCLLGRHSVNIPSPKIEETFVGQNNWTDCASSRSLRKLAVTETIKGLFVLFCFFFLFFETKSCFISPGWQSSFIHLPSTDTRHTLPHPIYSRGFKMLSNRTTSPWCVPSTSVICKYSSERGWVSLFLVLVYQAV